MNDKTEIKYGSDALEFVKGLRVVEKDLAGWRIVYIEDRTQRKWLLDYPDSAGHGGGAPRVRPIP